VPFAFSRRYVEKMLKGALPDLLINIRTAKVLGIVLSATLLARADGVTEWTPSSSGDV
jgi:hypothetical protein